MQETQSTYKKKKKPGKTTAFFICLIVALMLWGIKALNTVYIYSLPVPVTFKNIPQHKRPVQLLPEQLKLELRASGLKLFLILANRPFKPVEIDFNNLRSINKQLNYILLPQNIKFNTNFRFENTIRQVTPDTLYFAEKSGYQKNVPVKVPLYIKCSVGYGYSQPEISPPFASVIGDSTTIKKIDTLYTQPLVLQDLNENVQKKLQIIRPNENTFSSIQDVTVKIKVDKLMEHFVYVPIEISENDPGIKSIHVFPAKVRVKFTALQNSYDAADTLAFAAKASRSMMKNGRAPILLSTKPGNINVLSLEPREAEILIIRK